jgi:hypothetical protein
LRLGPLFLRGFVFGPPSRRLACPLSLIRRSKKSMRQSPSPWLAY